MNSSMNTFTIGEIVYQFGTSSGLFTFTLMDQLSCEEYTTSFEDTTHIFDTHPIIRNVKVLEEVLKDGLNGKPCANVTFEKSISQQGCDIYKVLIAVNVTYADDTLVIDLSKVDKHITPKQVIEHIDYRFGQYIPEVTKKISDFSERIEKRVDDIVKEHTKDKVDGDITVSELKELVCSMKSLYETLNNSFIEYVRSTPFIICSDNNPINGGLMHIIGYNISKLNVTCTPTVAFGNPIKYYSNSIKYYTNACGLYYGNENQCLYYRDFDTTKFKYTTQLEDVRFENCEFENLEFMHVDDKLKKVTVVNMPTLISIRHLSKFPNIEEITISKVCNVNDLCKLADCKNLKILTLAKGTNTGCFQDVINFKIVME